MFKKLLALVVTVAALGAATLVSGPTRWALAQTPTITVSPASGTQFQTFTFVGRGFAPGTELEEAYYSPDGLRFTFYIGGVPAVVVVGADGTFAVSVNPVTDFAGAAAGTWIVEFCILDTDICWTGTVTITAAGVTAPGPLPTPAPAPAPAPAPRPGTQAPTITVSPVAGNQFQTFTFVGRGFAPGTQLEEAFYSPDGERLIYFINGVPAVIVVRADGTFSVTVNPATDFEGEEAGTWTVEFCIRGTDTCWTGEFVISL